MIVSHWSANAAVLAVALAVAAVHLRGLRGMTAQARRDGGQAPRGLGRDAAAFYCGLLLVVLALCSPLAYWSGRLIWVRSVQDLLLATVAPAFLVLGAPWLALRDGSWRLAARSHRRPGGFWGVVPPDQRGRGRSLRLPPAGSGGRC